MKKLLIVYVVLFFTFFSYLYNFHLKESAPTSQEEKKSPGEMTEKYVMVTFQAGIDYWKSAIKGFEDAANELNVSVEYRGATQYDAHEQITVLEQVIAKKPAGIAISAINPDQLNTTINKAIESGIPVVLFDSDAPDSKAQLYLGTNNYTAGVTGAHKMAELIGSKGKVGVITLPNQLNHKQRKEGFVDTIKRDYPKIEIVSIIDGKGDQIQSELAAINMINDNPDIQGIFASEANGGVGIADAIQVLKEDITIISFDTDKRTLDKIKNGEISASLAQGTWNMGYWSLLNLFQQNHKNYTRSKQTSGITQEVLNGYVDTGISIVTKENVEEYYAN